MSKNLFLRRYLFLIILITIVCPLLYLHQFTQYLIPDITTIKHQLSQFTLKYSDTEPISTETKLVIEELEPIVYISKEILDEHFDLCLTLPFSKIISNVSKNVGRSPQKSRFNEKKQKRKREVEEESILNVLHKFSELSRLINIQTVIIEPLVLFCMLSAPLKKKLLQRNVTISTADKFHLSLGIFEKYTDRLQTEKALSVIQEQGFEVEFIKRTEPNWMNCSVCNDKLITTHIFFRYQKWTLHVVVFFQRKNYLWHSGLMYEETLPTLARDNIYFLHSNGAFENFTAASLGEESRDLNYFNIPSNPAQFLFQIESSKFLECNMTIVENFKKLDNKENPTNHSQFSTSKFNELLVKSLKELKTQFDPFFIRFWIWSGTMLGWYRECGVIPYTGDIDFGAWSSDVDDLDSLVKIFQNKSSLHLRERMGVVGEGLEFNLNCDGVRVDVFFCQTESNGTWYAGHRPSKGYYFKYHHPHFSLCSAELLDQKVLVPCQAEHVIATEYGPNWMKPVSYWNYESSIYNRGPNIYWKKSMLKKVYPDL